MPRFPKPLPLWPQPYAPPNPVPAGAAAVVASDAAAVVPSLDELSLPHEAATNANATATAAKRADVRILDLMFSPLVPTLRGMLTMCGSPEPIGCPMLG